MLSLRKEETRSPRCIVYQIASKTQLVGSKLTTHQTPILPAPTNLVLRFA